MAHTFCKKQPVCLNAHPAALEIGEYESPGVVHDGLKFLPVRNVFVGPGTTQAGYTFPSYEFFET